MVVPRLPAYYLSHGGGPWPYMKEELGGLFDQLEASIKDIPRQLGVTPQAILVVSGHWEEATFSVSANPKPAMIYDYGGFPEHTYHVHYRAPGSPTLARRVQTLLQQGGLDAQLDKERGFDHGTFSLLEPLYPQADIPVVQLSIEASFDPSTHMKAGQLLAPLRDEGVLIIGSGSSYHNVRRFDSSAAVPSRQFDAWLNDTLVHAPPTERSQLLINWTGAPAARFAHPREDHLLPLMVAVGAARDEHGACIYHQEDMLGGLAFSSFRFGNAPGFEP
jgi:aromatic ring-opening dioxygenase catalytic subunit (LigB family)